MCVQIKCFHEIITIGYNVYHSYDLPWFRTLSWWVRGLLPSPGLCAAVTLHPIADRQQGDHLAASKPETLGLLCVDQCHVLAALVKEKLPQTLIDRYLERARIDKVCPVVNEVQRFESHDLCKGQHWQASPLRDGRDCLSGMGLFRWLWNRAERWDIRAGERAGAALSGGTEWVI